jgi:hypothetical protein
MLIRIRAVSSLVVAVSIASIAGPISTAGATFPGANGRIAFVSDIGGRNGVYTMNRNGGDVSFVAASSDIFFTFQPEWSPDGSRLVFSGDATGDRDIYAVNSDGSGLEQLTDHPADDQNPAWSPDGRRIVFSSYRSGGGDADLYVMNADGTGVHNITSTPTAGEFGPDWSPDGRQISFDRYGTTGTQDVWTIDLVSRRQVNLTPGTPASFDGAAGWSPDGKNLVFGSSREGGFDLFVMRADGAGVHNITPGAGNESEGSWSPDGTSIVFSSDRTGNYDIFISAADGSDAVNVTRSPATELRPTWQPLRRSLGDGLFTVLRGAAEVPGPGDPDGLGVAIITLGPRTGQVCAWISTSGITTPTAAHIHAGRTGIAGPVLIDLTTAVATNRRCVREVDPATIRAIRRSPDRYYVNVHTGEFPDGAIRGQLRN